LERAQSREEAGRRGNKKSLLKLVCCFLDFSCRTLKTGSGGHQERRLSPAYLIPELLIQEDLEMRTSASDFAPYRRSTVGFDRLFNLLEAGTREDDGYPPFDIRTHPADPALPMR
jgi:hypothetical protein